MTLKDAEPLIISELRSRLPRVPYRKADAGIDHYFDLRRERPELFEFRCHGHQWVAVRAMMQKHGLIAPWRGRKG